MRTEAFNEIIMETQNITNKMLIEKGEEYATDGDRLHNFRVAAQLKGESMESALWGFTVKHIVSVADMVRRTEDAKDPYLFPESQWNEKLMDAINYLSMLRVVRADRTKENSGGNVVCVPQGSVLLKERR